MLDDTPAPLPRIRCLRLRDVLYVRAEDVADALDALTLPGAEHLTAKLRKAAA